MAKIPRGEVPAEVRLDQSPGVGRSIGTMTGDAVADGVRWEIQVSAQGRLVWSRLWPVVGALVVVWWLVLTVVAAVVIALVVGASGRQAKGSGATATMTALAQRYIAAGMWTPGQAAMFASNGKWVVVPESPEFGYGHVGSDVPPAVQREPGYYGTIEAAMAAHDHVNVRWTGKERLVLAGPDGFTTAWTVKGFSTFTGKNFVLPGVSVSQVKNGKIVLQKVYFDPAIVYGPAGPPR